MSNTPKPIPTVKDFIGDKAQYDSMGQNIFGNKNGDLQMIVDVRGWGAIQHLFDKEADAANFQDELGEWIADAINQKLNPPAMNESLRIEIEKNSIAVRALEDIKNWDDDMDDEWDDQGSRAITALKKISEIVIAEIKTPDK